MDKIRKNILDGYKSPEEVLAEDLKKRGVKIQHNPYQTSTKRAVDTSSLKYVTDYNKVPIEHWESENAKNQGNGVKVFNSLLQSAAEIGGGILEGAELLGKATYIGLSPEISFSDEKAWEMLSETLGGTFKEEVRHNAPVLSNYSDKFAPLELSWWTSHAPSLASWVGLATVSGAATKIASKVSRGGINIAKKTAKKGLKSASVLGAEADFLKATAGRTSKFLNSEIRNTTRKELIKRGIKGVSQAGISRNIESIMEGGSVYTEVRSKLLAKGISSEIADKKAAEAARGTYLGNWAMILQDIPQYMAFRGKMGMFSKGSASVSAGREIGKQFLSEGFEEGYQFGVGDYNKRKALGEKRATIADYAKDGEFWSSVFFGGLGGAGMQAFGAITSGELNPNRDYKAYQKQKAFQKDIQENNEIMSRIADADENGDFSEQVNTRFQGLAKRYKEALKLDIQNGNSNSIDTLTETLEHELQQGEHTPEMKAALQEDLNLAKKIKTEFEALVESGNSIESATNIAMNNFYDAHLKNQEAKTQASLAAAKSGLGEYIELSSEGQEAFNTRIQLEAAQKKQKELDRAEGSSQEELTAEQKESLSNKKKAVQESIKRLEEQYKQQTQNLTQEELDTLDSTEKFIGIIRDTSKLNYIKEQRAGLAKATKLNRDKEFQRKSFNEKINNVIDNADSLKELESIQNNQEGLTSEHLSKIKAKQKEIISKENEKLRQAEKEADPSNEAKSAISSVLEQARYIDPNPTKSVQETGELSEDLFDDALDFSPTPEQAKLLKEAVETIHNNLGENSTFEDLIKDFIRTEGKEATERFFGGIKEGWIANNFKDQDYKKVYDKYFGAEQAKKSIRDMFDALNQAKKDGKTPSNSDEQVSTIGKTNTTSPKAAYNAIERSEEDPVGQLKESDDLNPFAWSNPNKYKVGDKVVIEKEDNVYYIKDIDTGEKLAQLHKEEYYDSNSYVEVTPGDRQKAKDNLKALKEYVDKNGKTTIAISYKGAGKIKPSSPRTLQPLSSYNPDAFVVVLENNTLMGQDGVVEVTNIEEVKKQIETDPRVKNGVDFFITTDANGNKVAIGRSNASLPVEVQETILTLIEYHLYPQKYDTQRLEILRLTDYDIASSKGLAGLLSMYVSPNRVGVNKDGRVVIGNDKIGKQIVETSAKSREKLKQKVSMMFYGISTKALKDNKKVLLIKNGTAYLSKPYNEFIKDLVHTNLESKNIGDQENPMYITHFNPFIEFDINSVENAQNSETLKSQPNRKTGESQTSTSEEKKIKEQVEQAAKEVIETAELTKEEKALKLIEELALELEEKYGGVLDAKEDDFENDPSILDAEDLENITGNLSKIRGLDPVDIFHISNFLYNSYLSSSTLEEGDKKFLNFYESKVKSFREKASQLDKVYQTNPEKFQKAKQVSDNYTYLADTAQEVINNFPTLKEEIVERLKTEDTYTIESKKDKNHYQNSLEKNPKATLSTKVRQILEGIEKEYFDSRKNRIQKEGPFGETIYESVDLIYEKMMEMFADGPATYNYLLKKLNEHKAAYPWVEKVITKLEQQDQQTKNQFVVAMTSHSMDMRFIMFAHNARNNEDSLRVYQTNSGAVNRAIIEFWKSKFRMTNLVTGDNEINMEVVPSVIESFEQLKGKYAYKDINMTDQKEISTAIKDVQDYLEQFGVYLSEPTVEDLIKNGMMYLGKHKNFKSMFTEAGGLFHSLNDSLLNYQKLSKTTTIELSEGIDTPLDQGIIKQIANLDAKYVNYTSPLSIRDGGKTLSALIENKFLTKRTNELKEKDSSTLQMLANSSFSSRSHQLQLLINNDRYREEQFSLYHLGLTSFKEFGRKTPENAQWHELSYSDRLYATLGFFQDVKQGKVKAEGISLPGTLEMRTASMHQLNHSDKSVQTGNRIAVYDFQKHHLISPIDGKLSDVAVSLLFDQLVLSEVDRMLDSSYDNVKAVDKGRFMFYFLPNLNEVTVKGELLISFIENSVKKRTPKQDVFSVIESEFRSAIEDQIQKDILNLIKKKQEFLEANVVYDLYKIGDRNVRVYKGQEVPDGAKLHKEDLVGRLDIGYMRMKEFNKEDSSTAIKLALLDFEINQLISAANLMMLYNINPSQYFKSKANNKIDQARETFDNISKRMAGHLGPGIDIPLVEGDNTYHQLFMNDSPKQKAENYEYLKRLGTEEGFDGIESTDAQEYTTWKEHLKLLERLGKIPGTDISVSKEEITSLRELMENESKHDIKNLTQQERDLLDIFQPMKPQFFGDSSEGGYVRQVFIKTSSYPLIPQLTKGLEIDKLRVAMESYEDTYKTTLRATFSSGTKVGNLEKPLNIFKEGKIITEDLSPETLSNYTLELDRKYLKIQQNIPFKSAEGKHKVSFATQMGKTLFGNGVAQMMPEEFKNYNEKFIEITEIVKQQLLNELRMENITDIPNAELLQNLLYKEAKNRNYPLQDIESLKLFKGTSEFLIPLWASPNANRYEALLNSIVVNRLAKYKFPGYSYVVGSEEGYNQDLQSLKDNPNNNIIWTSNWGGHLQSVKENGTTEEIEETSLRPFSDSNISERLSTKKKTQELFPEGGKVWFKNSNGELEERKIIGINTTPGKADSFIGLQLVGEDHNVPFNRIFEEVKVKTKKQASKSFTPNQVLVPAKFLDNDGKLIDLMSKDENGNPIYYTVSEDGRMMLKEDMIDSDLLSMTTWRTPTSGHVSMSQVEVVGFLPKISGDLMIVPRAFTIQKGLDFDVDKETAYINHHYINKQGKIKKLSRESQEKYLYRLEKQIEREDDEITLNLLKTIFGEDSKVKDYKNKNKLLKLQKQILENEIIDIHRKVLSDPRMQSRINKALSTDEAEDNAKKISEMSENSDVFTSPISFDFQNELTEINAAGMVGTGAYSQDVTLLALMEQNPASFNIKEDPDKGIYTEVSIDGMKSYGALGSESLGEKSRNISEVLAERQQIALDNAKLNVMGKVNINEVTIAADKALVFRGYDKFASGNYVSFVLMSQPIIKEYVKLVRESKSMTSTFSANRKEEIQEKLLESLYNKAGLDSTYESKELTEEDLLKNLKGEEANPIVEYEVLNLFIQLEKEGEEIQKIQGVLNVDSQGIGPSVFDNMEKIDKILSLPDSAIGGATELIGEFYPTHQVSADFFRKAKNVVKLKGKYKIDKKGNFSGQEYYIVPNNYLGNIVTQTVYANNQLWKKYFPYDTETMHKIYEEIAALDPSNERTSEKDNKLRKDVFKSVISYVYSEKLSPFFNSNPQEYRNKLFIDNETESLATYLEKLINSNNDKNVLNSNNNKNVLKHVKTNPLINRFTYELEKNGLPSKIVFNANKGESFNEEFLYNSIPMLIKANAPLPDFQGKPYTTKDLAQDLVAYAYLEGGIQQATQFVKYVPVSYITSVKSKVGDSSYTMASMLRSFHRNEMRINASSNKSIFKFKDKGFSNFTVRYVQHNPSKAYTPDPVVISKIEKKSSFSFWEFVTASGLDPAKAPTFVSTRDTTGKKGSNKYKLWMLNGGTYKRIPVLGVKGMKEWTTNSDISTRSLVNNTKDTFPLLERSRQTNVKTRNSFSSTPTKSGNLSTNTKKSTGYQDFYKIQDGNLQNVLENVLNNSPLEKEKKDILRILIRHINPNTTIEIRDSIGRGYYDSETDGININLNILEKESNSKYNTANTIYEEYIHSITVREILKYVDKQGKYKDGIEKNQVPKHVRLIVSAFRAFQRENEAELKDFRNRHIEKLKGFEKEALTPEEQSTVSRLQAGRDKNFSQSERDQILYRGHKITEFIVGALREKELRTELEKLTYLSGDQTLIERFLKGFYEFLESLGLNITEARDVVASILKFAEEESNLRNGVNNKPQKTEDKVIDKLNDSVSKDFEEDTPPWEKENFNPDEDIDKELRGKENQQNEVDLSLDFKELKYYKDLQKFPKC